jgi:methyl-accepting chemotaxis protein
VVSTPTPPIASPPAPATPAYLLTLEAANREFNSGDFSSAARDFNRYLQMVETGGARDQVLYHLGVLYASPIPALQDWNRALTFLKQVSSEFPSSPWKPMAELIVSMRDQTTQLTEQTRRMSSEAAQLQAQIDALRNSSSQLTAQINTLTTNAAQLKQDISQRDEKIRQLTTDLERIIRIDTQSRPRP